MLVFLLLSLLQMSPSMSSTCPLNFDYIQRIEWNISSCDENTTLQTQTSCCNTLESSFGVALAQHLKKTSLFRLNNLLTFESCLQVFQSKLPFVSHNLLTSCLKPLKFITSTDSCAHILSLKDWMTKLSNMSSNIHDAGCRSNLTELTTCQVCHVKMIGIPSRLIVIDGNASHTEDCSFITKLYMAGIHTDSGPKGEDALYCIFELNLKKKKSHHMLTGLEV